jgi:hypothetical protein
MKYINNSINKKFAKGFNNILSPTLLNLFIALSLLIIISLSYLKYNKIELYKNQIKNDFASNDINDINDINKINLDTDTGYMTTIIQNYIKSKQVKNDMQTQLDLREEQIEDISYQLNELIS